MAALTFGAYLLVGGAVAFALATRERTSALARASGALLHAVLWPLFVPLLFPSSPPPGQRPEAPEGPYGSRILEAEQKLAEALAGLGRELGDPLALEAARVKTFGAALRATARRLLELEAMVEQHRRDEPELTAQARRGDDGPEPPELTEIAALRLEHLRRMEALRDGAAKDLERALARASELSARLTLARFEEPASARAPAALARELTDSIEELCRVLTEVRST